MQNCISSQELAINEELAWTIMCVNWPMAKWPHYKLHAYMTNRNYNNCFMHGLKDIV